MRNVERDDGLTGRARSILVTAVVVLLTGNMVALAAHDSGSPAASSSAPPVNAGALDSDPGASARTGDPAPTTAPPTTRPSASRKGAATTTTAPTTTTTTIAFPTPTTWPYGYVYKIDLEPSCAAVGEEFKITFHLKPGGTAVMIATYADGQQHGTWHAAPAQPDGKVVHKWRAPPAPGPGTIVTEASDPEAKRKGTTNVDFRVVQVPGTC